MFCFVTKKIHGDEYNLINVRFDNRLSYAESSSGKT